MGWTALSGAALVAALAIGGAPASGEPAEPSPAARAPTHPGRSVLVLHSYFKGYKWTDDENLGIQSVLEPAVGAGNLFVEYMDSKRFYDERHLSQFPEIYRRKFLDHDIGLVVATDDNAFEFLKRYRDELFPGAPVVFCGVNYFRDEQLRGYPLFTGVSEDADVGASLDVALALRPGTRRIYSVTDETETGLAVRGRIAQLGPSWRGVPIERLDGLPMEKLLARLRALPAGSLVFHTFFFRDSVGKVFEFDESMRLISAASRAPVFGAWDFNLGYGLVGGMLTSGFSQGEAAGRIALRILGGERAASIPVVRDLPGRYMFDFLQLERWGIAPRALPPGSVVVNLPDSPYLRYRQAFLVGAVVLVFLVGANAVLLLNIRRRKRAEEELRRHRASLEETVRERSSELRQVNEELQRDIRERERTEKALRRAEENFRGIFENAAEGVYQSSPEGRFLSANPALAQMAGDADPGDFLERVRDIRRDFYVDPARRDEFEATLVASGEVRGFESLVRRRDGREIWVLENARAVRGEGGELRHYEGLVQDVTERKRADEALRVSRELLGRTFESLLDALFIVRAETSEVVDCNPAALGLFGYSREEILGASTRLIHVDEPSWEEFRARAFAAFAAEGFLHLPVFRMRRKDGTVFVSEHSVMPLHDGDGRVTSWVSVVRDITDQRRTHEKLEGTRRKLRSLAAALTRVEERERRAIATQLHDQLGALLAMAKVKLASLARAAEGTPLAAGLEEVRAQVGEAVQETRALTWELSPPILHQLGLPAALEWLAESVGERNSLGIVFREEGARRDLGEERRFLVFAAVRELLLNVVKHAGAKDVSIRLRWLEEGAAATVLDDGCGFEPALPASAPDTGTSFGLFSIQERFADLGGQVEIVSAPGAGTTVTLVLPYPPEADRKLP